MEYSYSDDAFSDLHKDVYGFRPRGMIMDNWNSMAPAEKGARWDGLCNELAAKVIFEKGQDVKAVERFKVRLANRVSSEGNREKALLFMTQFEKFYSGQCVEAWVYDKDILFTDYGKALVKELLEIVTYEIDPVCEK